MNIAAHQICSDQPAGVSIVSDARGLEVFRDPSCAAAVWDREIPPGVLTWLAQLDPAALPNGRIVLQPTSVKETVRHLCDIAGLPESHHLDWLVDDIAALAKEISKLMDAPYLRVRLQAVSTNACRKFHLDAITGRLVCTYRGTGTQYGTGMQGEEPSQIFTVPTGAPILLRGTLWPPSIETGILHRSPPIEGSGETRLVLVLDPVFDLDDAE